MKMFLGVSSSMDLGQMLGLGNLVVLTILVAETPPITLYLDRLGMTSTFDHKVFCRQTLIEGNCGLFKTTLIPNPNYHGSLLWHRLMGKNVLKTTHFGAPYPHAYSHCLT